MVGFLLIPHSDVTRLCSDYFETLSTVCNRQILIASRELMTWSHGLMIYHFTSVVVDTARQRQRRGVAPPIPCRNLKVVFILSLFDDCCSRGRVRPSKSAGAAAAVRRRVLTGLDGILEISHGLRFVDVSKSGFRLFGAELAEGEHRGRLFLPEFWCAQSRARC